MRMLMAERHYGMRRIPRQCCYKLVLILFLTLSTIADDNVDQVKGQSLEDLVDSYEDFRSGRNLLTVDGKAWWKENEGGNQNPPLPNLDSRPVRQNDHKPKSKRRPYPTGAPRPPLNSKHQVEWFEDTHYYALRASSDTRFRIRQAPIPAQGTPWPLPQLYQTDGITNYRVSPSDFQFHAVGETCDILEYGFERMRRIMFDNNGFGESGDEGLMPSVVRQWRGGDTVGQDSVVHYLNVTVLKECDGGILPSLEMDESYDLEVKRMGASLIAREIWGALRGMETFSQLVYIDDKNQMLINKTYIHDYPRFPHRGILLDSSRHYLTKDTILANLEAMAMNKFNVFHWHIVDDNSFPYQSKVFPNLTKMGAFDPVTHIYTHNDIREVIEYARLRGIRVIPEFDTPGHTYSWGYGQDHLLTPCYDYTRKPDGFFGPINPILKSTYRFLRYFFTEVLEVFPDKYLHLGGDEVPFDCWSSNPYLLSFMRRNNLTDVRDLLQLYERELLKIVTDVGEKRGTGSGYIVWQEVFDNGVKLKPDTIVQVWNGDTYDINRVTSAGYRTLFSACWYLDYIGYGQDWDKYYRCDQVGPHLVNYNVKNESLLIGGEACLWMEYADNEVLMARLWPRASAAAERLWSHRDVLDVDAAAPRIEEHRCRMIRNGLQVGVLSGPGYCKKYQNKNSKSSKSDSGGLFAWAQRRSPPEDIVRVNHVSAARSSKVYLVDMSAMYMVPLILIVCLCIIAFIYSVQDNSKNPIITFMAFPKHNLPRRGVKGLLFAFMTFSVAWFVWTSPLWLHTWESKNVVPGS